MTHSLKLNRSLFDLFSEILKMNTQDETDIIKLHLRAADLQTGLFVTNLICLKNKYKVDLLGCYDESDDGVINFLIKRINYLMKYYSHKANNSKGNELRIANGQYQELLEYLRHIQSVNIDDEEEYEIGTSSEYAYTLDDID